MYPDSSEEYVETSDVEEREEIQRTGRNGAFSGGLLGSDDDDYRPAKRVKLYHGSPQAAKLEPAPIIDETLGGPLSTANHSPTRINGAGMSPGNFKTKAKAEREYDIVGSVVIGASDVHMDADDDEELDGSQDPMLLVASPKRESLFVTTKRERTLALQIHSPVQLLTTHLSTQLNHRSAGDHADRNANTAQKDIMSRVSASPPPISALGTSTRSVSPTMHEAQSMPSSPNHTSRQSSPVPVVRIESSSSERPGVPEESIPAIVQQMQEKENKRYSLRNRNPMQIQPYSLEQVIYKQTMKRAPEAIVKIRNPGRHVQPDPDDQYEEEEEESQYIAGETMVDSEDDDGAWEDREIERERERERRTDRRAERETNAVRNPGGGDDFLAQLVGQYDSSSDDEQDAEMQKMAKEIEKDIKERKRRQKKKEREEEARRKAEKLQAKATSRTSNYKPPAKGPSPFPCLADPQDEGDGIIDVRTVFETYAADDVPSDPEVHDAGFPNLSPPPNLPDPASTLHRDTIEILSDSENEARQPRGPRRTRSSVSIAASSARSSDGSDSDSDQLDRGAAILNKMYPPGLARALLKQTVKKKPPKSHRHSSMVLSDGEEHGGLKPGQTKVRRAAGATLKEIKGDTESESEGERPREQHHLSDSSLAPLPPTSSSFPYSSPPPFRRSASFYDSDHSDIEPKSERDAPIYEISEESEVEELDTKNMGLLLRPTSRGGATNPRDRPVVEKVLIDYMLSGTRSLCDRKDGKRTARKSKPKTSGTGTGWRAGGGVSSMPKQGKKYKFDVVTRGGRKHGTGRQPTLHHFGYTREPNRSTKHSSSRRAKRGHSDLPPTPEFTDDEEEDQHPHQVPVDLKQRTWKQKQRERKARIKSNGLFIVNSGTGGRSFLKSGPVGQSQLITVDVEEEDGHFVPRNANHGAKFRQWEGRVHRQPRPAESTPAPHRRRVSSVLSSSDIEILDDQSINEEASPEPQVEETHVEERLVLKDSGVLPLRFGLTLGLETYVGKGYLHELICIVNGTHEPRPVNPLILHGFEKFDCSGDLDAKRLHRVMETACHEYFEFSQGLPYPDKDRDLELWGVAMRHVSHAVTDHLSKESANARGDSVKEMRGQIKPLLTRMESETVTDEGLDVLVLHVEWFAIEISTRLGDSILDPRGEICDSSLAEAIKLMVRHLLTIGLGDPLRALENQSDGIPPDPTDANLFAAELWVRLIHLLCELAGKQPSNSRRHPHLFWRFVLDEFKSAGVAQLANALFIEQCWNATFSLCALSQFSIRGMVVSKPHLPACWDIVKHLFEHTLKQITADTDAQDRYIRYILSRCLIFQERWQWKIADISGLVKEVVDNVFAPRKFANLGTEKPEFPGFLRRSNRDTISAFEDKDSAYTILLKFITKAAKDGNENKPGKGISASIKKLISLSEPVSTFSFKNGNQPQVSELSMLVNRITAAVIASYLDPSMHETKVNQVRKVVEFKSADRQTQYILIRGMFYWAQFLVRRQPTLKLDFLASWAAEMASALEKEYHSSVAQNQHNKFEGISMASGMLLAATGKIYLTQQYAKQYPEILFLSSVKPLIGIRDSFELKTPTQEMMMMLVNARFAIIPPDPPPLPPPPAAADKEEDEEESQDIYGDPDGFGQINWGAVDIAELGAPVPAEVYKEQDKALKKLLTTYGLIWVIYRVIKEAAVDTIRHHDFKDVNKWLQCWIGCRLIGEVQVEIEKPWFDETLRFVGGVVKAFEEQETEARKFDMLACLALLHRHPKCYLIPSVQDYLVQNVLSTLVTIRHPDLSWEAKYVADFLSVDQLRHPLLRDCTCLPPSDAETRKYNFTHGQFLQFQLPMIDVILHNLNHLLIHNLDEAKSQTTLVKGMFSAMRTNLLSLAESRQQPTYAIFCREVVANLKDREHLSRQHEFEFWSTWTP